jgi:hypothetical protein
MNPMVKKFVIKKAWILDKHKNKIIELTSHNPGEVFDEFVEKEKIVGGIGKNNKGGVYSVEDKETTNNS